jgi:hypothetical protein
MTAPPDSIARTQRLLEVCGFLVLPLVPPGLRGTWHLVAFTAASPGVLLVAVLADMPDPASPRLSLPGGLPPASRRLIHVWPPDGPLPAALTL